MSATLRLKKLGEAVPRGGSTVSILAVVLVFGVTCAAGDFQQKGFVEGQLRIYPQLTANDQAHVVGDLLARWEPSLKFHNGITLYSGFDVRTDSHHEVLRDLEFSWWDRTSLRPLFTVRRLSLLYRHKFLTVEVGKQFIRWGKTDILNPTDRFAPKDYLTVVDTDYLPVTAARATIEKGSNTVDLVYVPRFTPARIPLFNQRWAPAPPIANLTAREVGARFPGGPQLGIRWNHVASKLEYSLSYYDGYNYLPLITPVAFNPVLRRVDVVLSYPKLRAFGGDAAIPTRWCTVKAETEMFTTDTPGADKYLLYVVQIERQWKEWTFVGGYAGKVITERGGGLQYQADRGLTRALVGRASVNLSGNRTLIFEAVGRQNGSGFYAKAEYSQGFGQHWRASAMFTGIRGEITDFLGQYRRNSFVSFVMRYSF